MVRLGRAVIALADALAPRGARLRIPRLAAVAQRTGGSAFVKEARRLHELITTGEETA